MKKIIISIFTVFTLLSTWSCGDWLDVNHDPNAIEDVYDPHKLLPSTQVSIASNVMGWDFGFAGGMWVEYWTQNYTASQFKVMCEYRTNGMDFNTAYIALTSQALKDLRRIQKLTEDDESQKGLYFVSELLSIFTWQIIADVWGAAPYFEGLQGDEEVYNPKTDSGEVIYEDLLKRIDGALEMDLRGATVTPEFDFIYGGNLTRWTEFANSLKLKLMLRQSETAGYNNATVLAFVEDNDFITTSARIPGSYWDDTMEGKRHPFREFQAGGANYLSTNVIACKSFIDYIKDDPRIDKIYAPGDENEGHRGALFGDFDSRQATDGSTPDNQVAYSTAVFKGDMDLMIMSLWEVNFYIAEVYARANTATATATARSYYEEGVRANLAQWDIKDESIIEAGGYAEWVDGTVEENIHQIQMQRWVCHANWQHMESFLERNRTKYPPVDDTQITPSNRPDFYRDFPVGYLTVSVNGYNTLNQNLPSSPLYPDSWISRNINKPSQKPDLGQKVWWDQKAGK